MTGTGRTEQQKLIDMIQAARLKLMDTSPFFSILAMKLKINVADWAVSNGLPTAVTDGENIYFHPEIKKTFPTVGDLTMLLAHEVIHCAFNHTGRIEGRDPVIWNYAIDYATNGILAEAGLYNPDRHRGLYSDKYKNLSAESIYTKLTQDKAFQKNKPSSLPSDWNVPSSSGNNKGKSLKKNEKGKSSSPGSSGSGEEWKTLDRHIDPSMEINPKTGPTGRTIDGKKISTQGVCLSPESEEAIRKKQREWEDLLLRAAHAQKIYEQNNPQARGFLPSAIEILIDDIRTPKTNLKQMLSKYIKKAITNDNNWSIPKIRRLASQKIYLPSKINSTLDIAIVVDTSGSTCNDVGYFLGIIDEILKKLPIKKIRYMECDAAIAKDIKVNLSLDSKAGIEAILPREYSNSKSKFSVKGGGGTSFVPPFDRFREEKNPPYVIIYLTDGYGEYPNYKPNGNVIWVFNNKDSTTPKPPFGSLLRFDEADVIAWEKKNKPAADSSEAATTYSPYL